MTNKSPKKLKLQKEEWGKWRLHANLFNVDIQIRERIVYEPISGCSYGEKQVRAIEPEDD